jgi:hypothetical protein
VLDYSRRWRKIIKEKLRREREEGRKRRIVREHIYIRKTLFISISSAYLVYRTGKEGGTVMG